MRSSTQVRRTEDDLCASIDEKLAEYFGLEAWLPAWASRANLALQRTRPAAAILVLSTVCPTGRSAELGR